MSRFETNVGPGESLRPLPPALFLAAIVAIASISCAVPKWIAVPLLLRMVGGALLIGGMVVNIFASRQFRLADTPIRPFERATALVADGVFRWSRNPMYAGLVAALAGISLLMGSMEALPVALLYGRIIAVRFVNPEERALRERFGDEYARYAQRVRRWL